MEKELMIPEFVEHWDKDRAEKEEIKVTIEMAEKRELTSIILLVISASMMIASAVCLTLISRGVLW